MDTLVPERLCTARLQLRRPATPDAVGILTRYAGDPEVTRWLSFDTRGRAEISEGRPA